MKIAAVLLALALSSVEAVRVSNSAVERILSGKKSTGKDSGKGGSSSSTDPCDLCVDGRPDQITFKYVPADPSTVVFEKHTCALYSTFPSTASLIVKDKSGGVLYSGTVNDGMMFTVVGPFDADSFFEFVGFSGLDDGGSTCIVHTSCSDVLLPGYENRIGPFEIINDECTTTTNDECIICDPNNKVRPSPLTMMYMVNGQNSVYQTKATCVAGTYPPITDITVSDKDGNVLEVITGVVDGQVVEIGATYELGADTIFSFDGLDDCTIHTSCSQPLVVNDIIGPFKLLAGNDCDGSECVKVDKVSYVCDEPITVTFDLTSSDPPATALRDDWIGFYPCDAAIFYHSVNWQWTCGTQPTAAFPECVPTTSGSLLFDGIKDYNLFGPSSEWPLSPGCWKAVILRNDGPSVPPYIEICESESFQVTC